ncbi:phage holin family protein [Cereibacter sphaeroides]|uniref:phage holin family protein n=1 Tax=Cereibacter sphaeroides TaxID=1063 RepID=UPI000F52C56D|nr:phage holin family protein [Cereibacter sphaeroides]AZB70172.1 hypothetical protein EBL86_17375 [Cereibacter sphaeroides]
MGASMKNASEERDFSARSALTLGAVAGALVGFLIAMALGAFSVGQGDDVTEWISAVTSIAAVLVSLIAVVLVSQTLKATQDALKETRAMSESQDRMAADQRYIGISQTRPWICISSASLYYDEIEEEYTVSITVENFGPTPARAISMSMGIRHYPDADRIHPKFKVFEKVFDAGSCSLIPPKKDYTFRSSPCWGDIRNSSVVTVFVQWEYRSHDGSPISNSEDQAEYLVSYNERTLYLELIR